MIKLSEAIGSKSNNYNLIRFVAALMVLLSHSFPVVTGNVSDEPFRLKLGLTVGSVAVDVFFVISGFLVTESMRRNASISHFVLSRFLRVWPGLLISLIITALVLGTAYRTSVSLRDLMCFLGINAFPVSAVKLSVDGIFEGNPMSQYVNISLWTLPIELAMYRNLLALRLASLLAFKRRRLAFDFLILLAAAYYSFMQLLVANQVTIEEAPHRLSFMFFTGAAAMVLANKISLSWKGFLLASMLITTCAPFHTIWFISYNFSLWYLVFFWAHLSNRHVLDFNRFGDYSYGLYIYAWPVQQSVIALGPNLSIWEHFFVSSLVVLIFAAFSWHVVERPALRLKLLPNRYLHGR